MGELLRHNLRNRGDYYPSVAMTDEHHLLEVLIFDYPENVLYVGVQPSHTAQEVRTLPKAAKGRCKDLMAICSQVRNDSSPTPSSLPTAGYKH